MGGDSKGVPTEIQSELLASATFVQSEFEEKGGESSEGGREGDALKRERLSRLSQQIGRR